MIDGELLGNASKMKINLLTALHFIAEAWRHITPITTQSCFKKCDFSSDGEYIDVSNDVLNEQGKDNWCSMNHQAWNLMTVCPVMPMSVYVRCKVQIRPCRIT
jgi:hypothetical protein